MPKYIGLPYEPKERQKPINRMALSKTFLDDNPERDALLNDLIERLNMVISMSYQNQAREAHDTPYTDAGGTRTNIGDAIESLEDADHARLHGIDSTDDHNGVTGATEDNFVAFDASGLPKDSGSAAASFDAAGAAAAVASDLNDHENDTANPHGVTAAQANAIPVEPSSTDNAIVRWDGVGGDAVQDSAVFIDDSGNIVYTSGLNRYIKDSDGYNQLRFYRNGADMRLYVPGGFIGVGEDDTTRGYINIYGGGAGVDWTGALYIHMSADHDGTVASYKLQGFEDDLYIGPSTNADFLTLTAEGVFQIEGEARLDAHASMGSNDASLATKKYVDDEVSGAGGGTRWQRMLNA